MAFKTFTQSIAAGATFDPLDSWQYQYTESPGILKLVHNATATGLRFVATATEITIVQDSPVPAGGTAGTIPSEFAVSPIIEKVAARKRLSIVYTNPTGGAITVNGSVDLANSGSGDRPRTYRRKGRK